MVIDEKSLRDYMEKWQRTTKAIDEIKTMLGDTHACKHAEKIGKFEQVIDKEIPAMKKSIEGLDDKFGKMNESVILIKDKVLNGSLSGVSPLKFWSSIGGIILTFGTVIIWILGQIK